jgi:hypothetical protein
MTSLRSTLALLFFTAGALFTMACGPTRQDCNPSECNGCCDSAGICQPGTVQSACGLSGSFCMSCSGAQICSGGACIELSGGGGGAKADAGNDAGTSDGGNTDGGNTCGPATCPGCCDGNGTCQAGVVASACGAAGSACVSCSSTQTCSAGECVTTGGGNGGTDGGNLAGDTCTSPEFVTLTNQGGGYFTTTINASTQGYTHTTAGSCGGNGPDRVYAITTTKTLAFGAQATATSSGFQPVVYVRSACASGERLCAPPGSFVEDAALPAGTWYIWVDGASGTSGSFTLEIMTYDAPKPGDTCTDAQPLAFSGGSASASGDTTGYTDTVNTTTATCSSLTGGDMFFTFSNPTTQNFTVTVTPQSSTHRPAVYLRSTCTGSTLSCATAPSTGSAVTLSYPNLPAGNYVLVVDGASGSAGPFSLSAQLSSATGGGSGDTCSSPIALTFSGGTTKTASASGTTFGATNAHFPTSCVSSSGSGKDRVYVFTTTAPGNFSATVTPSPGWDVGIHLRTSPCASGSLLVCKDDSASGSETISYSSLPAGTYYLWIEGYDPSAEGDYSLSATLVEQSSSATGNTCADPIVLTLVANATGLGASATGTTVGATNNNSPSPCQSSSGSGNDRVYSFTTTSTRNLTATVTPSPGWDVGISLRSFSCTGTQLVCKDDSATGAETITYASLPAGTHYLWVDAWEPAAQGNYSLSLTLQ